LSVLFQDFFQNFVPVDVVVTIVMTLREDTLQLQRINNFFN